MNCLEPELLQAFADGVLDLDHRVEVDLHLRACPACRDASRALQRVEGYLRHGQDRAVPEDFAAAILDRALAGEFAAPRPVPAMSAHDPRDEDGVEDAGGDRAPVVIARRGMVASVVTLAAAACVVGFVLTATPAAHGDGASSSTEPRAEGLAHERLVDALRVAMPDPSIPPAAKAIEGLAEAGYDGVLGRGAELHALRSAWRRVRAVDDRVRLARFAARIGAPGFRANAERLAMEVTDEDLAPALYAVAAFGGRDAARSLDRIARRREVAPGLLAEALLRTGTERGASRIWALLMAAETPRPQAYDALHRMGGREASRILVNAYLAGDGGAALRRVIAERADALALLRAVLEENDVETRLRALRMLGEAGDGKAVPLLARMAGNQSTRSTALDALHKVAQSGSEEAMLALARALPLIDDACDWKHSAESLTLMRYLRALPEGAGATFLLARHASGRASERRRYLVAAGLSGDADVESALAAALQRPQERRAALLALALSGRRSALAAIRPYTRSHDRRTRRCALAAVAALGGDEGARILSAAMRRTADRRTVMRCVRFAEDRWVVPVYVDGLEYRDTREDCLKGLRRLFDGRGPRSGEPAAWKAWLGLEPERSEETDSRSRARP